MNNKFIHKLNLDIRYIIFDEYLIINKFKNTRIISSV